MRNILIMMKDSRIKMLLAGGLIGLQMGCTQTVIVFKPSPILDPMPITDRPAQVEEKEDPLFNEQWNLAKVGVTKESLKSLDFLGNYNIRVGILSTGVDYNQDDLIGQIDINKKEITQINPADKPGVDRKDSDGDGKVDNVVGWDVVDGDGFAYDRHGAGTAVAGIIAARQNNGIGIAGIMKNVTIYPIRYIDDHGQSNINNLVAALEVASKQKLDVVFIQSTEIPAGGLEGDGGVVDVEVGMLDKWLTEFQKQKVPVIVGAGDDLGVFGDGAIHKTLAKYENVVVITASDKNDQLPLLANMNKGFDGVIRTMAPGEDILSLKPLNKTGVVHGTAYAAAHVTAAYALAKAQFGDRLSYEDYNKVLIDAKGSDKLSGMDRFSRGGNRLNIQKFLAELRTR